MTHQLKSFIPKKTKELDNIEKIKVVAEMIYKSKRPLIHLGHGARIINQVNMQKFIEKHNIPFALTWNASDLIQHNHPLFTGKPGAFSERGSNFIIQSSDLYISIGSRLPYMITGYNSNDFARNAKKIMVDIDNKELTKTNSKFIDVFIQCDALEFIKKLYLYEENK